ncbi:uncharacterized protein A4U43_C03F25160 [Asparagus officinalis]|uniref:Uncharacterized protein n=1 Tax=Asparagus officinalis TaxID=4686 RepID=A0A5P1FHT9_ASPOF|nr:uncharacterized protein A4U43_C03F25160 [Asparagus officinalis]
MVQKYQKHEEVLILHLLCEISFPNQYCEMQGLVEHNSVSVLNICICAGHESGKCKYLMEYRQIFSSFDGEEVSAINVHLSADDMLRFYTCVVVIYPSSAYSYHCLPDIYPVLCIIICSTGGPLNLKFYL